jgi:hypothetical protein
MKLSREKVFVKNAVLALRFTPEEARELVAQIHNVWCAANHRFQAPLLLRVADLLDPPEAGHPSCVEIETALYPSDDGAK